MPSISVPSKWSNFARQWDCLRERSQRMGANGMSRTRTSVQRAVIYCRVSSTGQEDNSSLQTQEEQCRTYAAERGWSVVSTYREVHSGAELFERPQLTLLREAMRRHEFDVLLVHALDRLSR